MEKYRIAFTVQDYYTNPYYSIKERMLQSIPEKFKKNGYNIKFKTLHRYGHMYYRVHMSVRMTEKEIEKVFEKYKDTMFELKINIITKHF